jgi:curved DNA-binding protein CbpA
LPKFKDYYQVLGIPPRSHARVIEESYWEQAHELHSQPTRRAARRLSVINEAYEVLGSPHRRDAYDRLYADRLRAEEPPPRPGLLHMLFDLVGKAFRPD